MATRAQPSLWRESVKAGAVRSGALLGAVALFAATAAMAAALASYHPGDSALNTQGGSIANWLGAPGAWFADLALTAFGPAAALLLPVAPIVAVRLWRDAPAGRWGRMLRGTTLGVALMASALAFVSDRAVLALPAGWGGIVGLAVAGAAKLGLAQLGQAEWARWGAIALGVLLGVAGVIVWARSLDLGLGARTSRWRAARAERFVATDDDVDLVEPDLPPPELRRGIAPRAVATPDPRPAPIIGERTLAPSAARPKPQPSLDLRDDYELPSLDLLIPSPPTPPGSIDKAALERNARLLETVLDDFNVRGQIVEVRQIGRAHV